MRNRFVDLWTTWALLVFIAFIGCSRLGIGARAFSSEAQAQEAGSPPKEDVSRNRRVVIQINESDPERIAGAFKNIDNIARAAEAQGRRVDFRAVVFGGALVQVVRNEPKLRAELIRLQSARPVVFEACQNAMNASKIVPAELPAGMPIVPAGALQVIDLQAEGYIYYRP